VRGALDANVAGRGPAHPAAFERAAALRKVADGLVASARIGRTSPSRRASPSPGWLELGPRVSYSATPREATRISGEVLPAIRARGAAGSL